MIDDDDMMEQAQTPWRDEPPDELTFESDELTFESEDGTIQCFNGATPPTIIQTQDFDIVTFDEPEEETRRVGDVLGHGCPNCNMDMVLRRGKFGLFYACTRWPQCDGTHGAHQKTGMPLGTPANKETRRKRMDAHAVFDKLWKNGHMGRGDAYKWLARAMSMDEVHIGELDLRQCELVIIVSNARLRAFEKTRRTMERTQVEKITGGRGGTSRQERKTKKRKQAAEQKAAKKETKHAGRQYRSLGDDE